jgi:uncharacterized caspase-like protein
VTATPIGFPPVRGVRSALLGIIFLGLTSAASFAEKRVALVMGNSAYQNVSRLANPGNDSEAMSATLKGAGFDVVNLKRDLKANEMRRALRDFSDSVSNADIAIVYFAGHGIEIDGSNYIIPVDAVLERDIDAYDEAISLERLLTVIEPARQLRLVILDACRDNPFNKTMKRTIGSRAVGRGLAKVEPTSPNTLIAYAAKAGSTASDGDSKNSPFTAALVKYLPRPGLDLRRAFGFARDEVLKVTNSRQEPFVYGSLGGEDVPLVPATPQVAPAAASVTPAGAPLGNPAVTGSDDPEAAIRRTYELALQVGTPEVWDSFISNYPNSFYTDLAKAQRRKLMAEEARLAATEKAKAAQEDQTRLAIEGAKAVEQARAAAQAKAAEEARVAAERKKAIEDAKLAEAERVKAAAQAKAVEDARLAAEKKKALEEAKAAEAERVKAAAQAKADEDARIAAAKAKAAEEAKAAQQARAAEKQKAIDDAKAAEAERAKAAAQAKAEADAKLATDQAKAADEKKARDEKQIRQLAALTPSDQSGEAIPKSDKPAPEDIPRLLQTELRRVGCNSGAVDGNWNAAAQKSLVLFNKNAGTQLDVKVASLDALDAVRSRASRICPLICDDGYKADGERCIKITCRAGYLLGDNGACERIKEKKPVKRDAPAVAARPSPDRPAAEKPAERKTAGSSEALYAQCRVMAEAKFATKRKVFNAMERCALSGGRL